MKTINRVFDRIAKIEIPQFGRSSISKKELAQLLSIYLRPLRLNRSTAKITEHIVQHGTKSQQAVGRSILDGLAVNGYISTGLQPFVDPVLHKSLELSETKGKLIEGLESTINRLTRETQNTSQIIKRNIYFFTMLCASTFLLCTTFREFALDNKEVIGGAEDPYIERVILLSNIYIYLSIPLAAAVVAISATIRKFLGNYTGANRDYLDRNVFKLYRLWASAIHVSNFSMLKEAGMPGRMIFDSIASRATPYVALHCARSNELLQQSASGSQPNRVSEEGALDTGLLDQADVSLINLYCDGAQRSQIVSTLREASEAIFEKISAQLNVISWIIFVAQLALIALNLLSIVSLVAAFDPSQYMTM